MKEDVSRDTRVADTVSSIRIREVISAGEEINK
jgi:hypothetical protein